MVYPLQSSICFSKTIVRAILIFVGVVILHLAPSEAMAQYEVSTCVCGETKNAKSRGFPKNVAWEEEQPGDWERNASSCLYAGKYKQKIPAHIPPAGTNDRQTHTWYRARVAYAKHTCQYAPGAASDGKLTTAWCEGQPGDGIGEVLGVYAGNGRPSTFKVFAGFGKSKELHLRNNRPKDVHIHLMGVGKVDVGQVATYGSELKHLSTTKTTLADRFDFQTVKLNPPKKGSGYYDAYFVFVEIRSVYKGTKYRDTCIAELRVAPDLF